MKLKEYLELIKNTMDKDELFKLNHNAISDDNIAANEFGQIKQAIDRRKTELKIPQYTAGSRLKNDD